jgi:2-polyprenyl-6-methoxyphenol hydroxylase-like FAD-dependent oxidoreductase
LAAAIAVRRRGFDVTVADAAIPPVDKACGEGIMPDGIRAAREIGIEVECGAAYPFRGIRFCERGRSIEAPFREGHGIGIRRTELHRLLCAAAQRAGVRMAWGVRIGGLDGRGVIAAGERVEARWVIGADGGNSRVRRWAGRRIPRRAAASGSCATTAWSHGPITWNFTGATAARSM